MNKYIFTKEKDLTNEYDHSKVVIEVEAIVAYDVVEEFYLFLLASGFHPNTAVRALEEVAAQHQPLESENE
jgi:hypothetical protein